MSDQVWVMKQDHRRVGEPGFEDYDADWSWWSWVGSGQPWTENGLGWRGPSNPTYTVESVHSGDLIVVYDLHLRVVHEAHIALGLTDVRPWFDYVDQRQRMDRGLVLVPVAGFPCVVEGDTLAAIKSSGMNTLNSVHRDFGEPLWRWIVAEASADARRDQRA